MQAGFRKGYSTVDHIYTLTSIIDWKLNENRNKLYCFFVDLTAAFDSINRDALFYKLHTIGMSNKLLSVLRNLYVNTTCSVWDGKRASGRFECEAGLKQGCLLSPILFALFLDDVVQAVGGGISVLGNVINVLMYADDLVLLADTPEKLQVMIYRIHQYCKSWGLTINIRKSQVIVFKKSSKLAKKEKWWMNKQQLEVVTSYRYLGMLLSSNNSLIRHFHEKSTLVGTGLNTVWRSVLTNAKVPFSGKLEVFNAALMSTVCYAAQVWGSNSYRLVEKPQRVFLKKILHLPPNTPTYALHLETNTQTIYLHTLKLHFAYIIKTLEMEETRLPNIITRLVIEKKTSWYNNWIRIFAECSERLDFGDSKALSVRSNRLIGQLKQRQIEEWRNLALQSVNHPTFNLLTTNRVTYINYLADGMDSFSMSLIFKMRTDMLSLNDKPWREEHQKICSLCSMGEKESTFHFMAVCPVLKEFRLKYLGENSLSEQQFISHANGKNWKNIKLFLEHALNFRKFLIEQFNY